MTDDEVNVARMCDAILKVDPVLAEKLLRLGVDPNATDRDFPAAWQVLRRKRIGSSLLHEAVMWSSQHVRRGNDPAVARVLLDAGADPTAKNDDGFQPLHGAALTNNVQCCLLLLKEGVDINAQSNKGFTPLHTAVYHDSAEAVEALLLHGARLDVKSLKGDTPAAYAARLNHPRVRAVLMAALARSTLRDLVGELNVSQSTKMLLHPKQPYAGSKAKRPGKP